MCEPPYSDLNRLKNTVLTLSSSLKESIDINVIKIGEVVQKLLHHNLRTEELCII